VTRGGARIALIERPIDQAIEEHRCRPREDHANHDQRQRTQRGPAIRGYDKRAEGKWERKNRVGKTNQPEKSYHRPTRSARLTLLILSVHSN